MPLYSRFNPVSVLPIFAGDRRHKSHANQEGARAGVEVRIAPHRRTLFTGATSRLLLRIMGIVAAAAAQAQSTDETSRAAIAWTDLRTAVTAGTSETKPGQESTERDRQVSRLVEQADLAKSFYTEFQQHAKAAEARRLEAVLLVEAVATGGTALRARMESAVQTFRDDQGAPPSERAIVAGTYDFHTAAQRIRSASHMPREYEAVARGLIREFPDQPQGYVSLLTQATLRDSATARVMAAEVVETSTAPEDVRTAAQRFITRLDLVGQSLEKMVNKSILRLGEADGWKIGQPGLLFFWATWNPESIALGEKLKARLPKQANVLAICLDTPDGALELGTVDPRPSAIDSVVSKLPGRVIKLAGGIEDDMTIRLGANTAPLLYLIAADGNITDVNGLADIEAKLKAAGL